MNRKAGIEEYILQTHNTKKIEDSMGRGLNPHNLPSRYASARASSNLATPLPSSKLQVSDQINPALVLC